MQLTIWTHWEGASWSGEIPEPADTPAILAASRANGVYEAALEYVFRFFNRVDEGDSERMAEVGYDLPSLSVGDVVTFADGSRWQCAPMGWELLEDDAAPLTPDALRGYDLPSGAA
jgi:hypothetical protein